MSAVPSNPPDGDRSPTELVKYAGQVMLLKDPGELGL